MKKILPVNFVPDGSRLIFIKQTIYSTGNHQRRKNGEKRICPKAIYKCICGKEVEKNIELVKSGHTKSCGCLNSELAAKRKRTHGLSEHPLRRIYGHIKGRCYTKTDHKYPDYGAIGVRMCREWLGDFKKFYDWCIANGWVSGLQVDKDIKARKNGVVPGLLYSPEWCSIVTRKQNCNSKRNNTFLEFNGQIKTISEWSDVLGISAWRISSRLQRKWSIEKTLTTPVVKSNNKK